MRKATLTTFVLLVLMGCAEDKETNFITRLAVVCESYATALDILAPRRAAGELSPKQVRVVNATVTLVHPVCAPGANVTDPQAAFLKINQAVVGLVTMKGE